MADIELYSWSGGFPDIVVTVAYKRRMTNHSPIFLPGVSQVAVRAALSRAGGNVIDSGNFCLKAVQHWRSIPFRFLGRPFLNLRRYTISTGQSCGSRR